MKTPIASPFAAAALLFFFTPARADAPATEGELWEMTATASVPGVPVSMKPYTTTLCQKKDWTQPPQTDPKAGDNCKTTDFARTGDKIAWKMSCESPPMTGEGEITFKGSDAYDGGFTMHTGKFDMHMALSGKKLGACDNPQ
jgi:hypothetical protein